MDLVAYDEPPTVRNSGSGSSSQVSTVDSGQTLDRGPLTGSRRNKVHFDQVNVSFVDPSQKSSGKNGTVVTARDGAPVVVKEHLIKSIKRKRAPISSYAPGPWPVVSQVVTPRTVKEKHLHLYIILSIIASILFFPTGVPALIFALKTKRLFYSGLQSRGEVSAEAIKSSRFCEKLLIVTIVCVILYAVVIFAVVEKITGIA